MTDRIQRHAPSHQGHLPRLMPAQYRGHAFVHWVLTMDNRRTGWLGATFHASFREVLLHAQARYGFACPVYCLMPDHVHMLWLGVQTDCRQRLAVEFLRKHTHNRLNGADWQKEPYDHVLREQERERGAFQRTAGYILDNPVRKKLVDVRDMYPYSGCLVAGYPLLSPFDVGYWETFWRIYYRLRDNEEAVGSESARLRSRLQVQLRPTATATRGPERET